MALGQAVGLPWLDSSCFRFKLDSVFGLLEPLEPLEPLELLDSMVDSMGVEVVVVVELVALAWPARPAAGLAAQCLAAALAASDFIRFSILKVSLKPTLKPTNKLQYIEYTNYIWSVYKWPEGWPGSSNSTT